MSEHPEAPCGLYGLGCRCRPCRRARERAARLAYVEQAEHERATAEEKRHRATERLADGWTVRQLLGALPADVFARVVEATRALEGAPEEGEPDDKDGG